MTNILFDYQAFEMQKYGGISRYFANIIQQTENDPDFNCMTSVLATKNYYFNKTHKTSIWAKPFLNFDNRRDNLNKNFSRYCLAKTDYDVFHPTYYHNYFLKYLKKPFVITVHDMIHERFPFFFTEGSEIGRKSLLINKASKIIAISNTTKQDILYFYPEVNENKIEVIHHGHNSILSAGCDVVFPDRYILFVGERRFYKNFFSLVDAFAQNIKHDDKLMLLCVGGRGFNLIERDYLCMRKLEKNVRQMTLTDNEIFHAYKNALLFIFPSLYEGFGLPLLEAFEANCPMLVSNISAFREVTGDAALYFDPKDINDLSEKIKWALEHANEMNKITKIGEDRLKKFSIDTCLDKTLKLYKSI